MALTTYLRKTTHDFASYTSITGFSQILRSSHWTESVFWFLTIVAGIALTVHDCSAPIIGYINEESYSTTSFLHNTTMSFPGASLCVEVDTSRLPLLNTSSLEDSEKLAEYAACLNDSHCYGGDHFFIEFKDHIFASALLLSRYSALESGRESFKKKSNKTIAKAPIYFYETLIASNVSSTSLLTMIGHVLCKAMQFKATFWDREKPTPLDFCAVAPVVWFGIPPKTTDETDLLCYSLDNLTQVDSVGQSYEIYFHPYAVLERQPDRHYDRKYAYLNVDGSPVSTDLEANVYALVPFDRCLRIYFNLVKRIVLMSKRAKPCEAAEPYFRCLGHCRVDQFASLCNCSAVSWERYMWDYGSLPATSCFAKYAPREYEECATAVKEARCKSACSTRCYQPCVNDVLYVETSMCGVEDAHVVDETVVAYSVLRMSYSLVEEKAMNDVSSLVSAVGGVAGLWLGAGFVGLLEAIILFPKALIDYVLCKREEGEEAEKAAGKDPGTSQLGVMVPKLIETLSETNRRLDDIAARLETLEKKQEQHVVDATKRD